MTTQGPPPSAVTGAHPAAPHTTYMSCLCNGYMMDEISIHRRPDPRRPAASSDPVEFVRTRLGLDPDPKQQEVLRSTSKLGILNCTRQWGKSTIAAAKAVHRAYTNPGCLVVISSPSGRQSAEFVRKAESMLLRLGITPRGDGDNKISLAFPNGSRIVGLPGVDGKLRGFSDCSLLLIDEASRVEDDTFNALTPFLANGHGDLWLMSTPFRKRGFFYTAWRHGGPEWHKIRVPATECPRISRDFLERERSTQRGAFDMEYMCEFREEGFSVFSRDLVERAIDPSLKSLVIPRLGTYSQ